MSNSKLDRLTVLGAGVLGAQIAWHSAFKGKHVVLYDLYPASLEKARVVHESFAPIYRADLGASEVEIAAARDRLRYSSDLADAVGAADLVIEAVPEAPEIKTRVYQDMAPLLPPHTLLATNSSTLLPGDFAAATGRPDKYCALHFANLIWAHALTEIMAHAGTSRETLTAATHFVLEIGMVPIAVQKEHNAYLLNSWLTSLLNSCLSLVVNGIGTVEDVDRTYMIANHCAVGPFGLMDVIGMHTLHNVCQHWGTQLQDAQLLKNAAYVKERFLDQGLQGALGGEGFYRYPQPSYAQPGFLAVPDAAAVPAIVERLLPR